MSLECPALLNIQLRLGTLPFDLLAQLAGKRTLKANTFSFFVLKLLTYHSRQLDRWHC